MYAKILGVNFTIPVRGKVHYWTINYKTVIRVNEPTGKTVYNANSNV